MKGACQGKNFSHAGGQEDSFDRQPPIYPSARPPDSRPLVSHASAGSGSWPAGTLLSLKLSLSHLMC